MIIHSSELREKDVINVCSGRRLGYVCDFMIDTDCGRITAVHVSDHYFGLTAGKNTLCIPWEKICCIGKDTILVQIDERESLSENCHDKDCDTDRNKRKKGGWLFG